MKTLSLKDCPFFNLKRKEKKNKNINLPEEEALVIDEQIKPKENQTAILG